MNIFDFIRKYPDEALKVIREVEQEAERKQRAADPETVDAVLSTLATMRVALIPSLAETVAEQTGRDPFRVTSRIHAMIATGVLHEDEGYVCRAGDYADLIGEYGDLSEYAAREPTC